MEKRSTPATSTGAGSRIETIEASWFERPRDPVSTTKRDSEDLHVCAECASELVYPTDWSPTRHKRWNVALRCPECEWTTEGVFPQRVVDRFDEVLDGGTDALLEDLVLLTQANMESWANHFVTALRGDHILVEDF